MTQAPPPDLHLQRTSRDAATLPDLLAGWLAGEVGVRPVVSGVGEVGANGMSSETILFDADWDGRTEHLVARVTPTTEDVPVFASYRLDHQFETLRLVGGLTGVPVPPVRWLEPTGSVLGTPFFVMDRVDGRVPPDVLPYNFGDNWLFDATPEEQRSLQDATVDVIAQLHAIPGAATTFGFLDSSGDGETSLCRHFSRTRDWYEFAAGDVGRSALVDRGLAWLEQHWPDEGETVLCWGDSRIGNVMYDGFVPAGVLDWEMAGVGPRELDLAWIVFAHRVFESITTVLELPGMPDFLREEDVRSTYQRLSGVEVGDLSWFQVYAAVQWGVVFMRTGARQVHFGEIEMPAEVDELFHHRALFESLLDGGDA